MRLTTGALDYGVYVIVIGLLVCSGVSLQIDSICFAGSACSQMTKMINISSKPQWFKFIQNILAFDSSVLNFLLIRRMLRAFGNLFNKIKCVSNIFKIYECHLANFENLSFFERC